MSKIWISRISKSLADHELRQLANLALTEEAAIAELLSLVGHAEMRIAQRASSVLAKMAESSPHSFSKRDVKKIIDLYSLVNSVLVIRNAARLLEKLEISEELQGEVMEKAFHFLGERSYSIAIRVFSMQILANQCLITPELTDEVSELIAQELPYGSTGFKNRGQKILRMLSRVQR